MIAGDVGPPGAGAGMGGGGAGAGEAGPDELGGPGGEVEHREQFARDEEDGRLGEAAAGDLVMWQGGE